MSFDIGGRGAESGGRGAESGGRDVDSDQMCSLRKKYLLKVVENLVCSCS